MNKSTDTVYLTLFDRPCDSVAVKGIRNKVRRASIVGGPEIPSRAVGGAPWAHLPGVLWLDIPQDALDPDATVIKLELEGPLDLYTGSGDVVTFNQ
jgi:alpha-L-fucosidase